MESAGIFYDDVSKSKFKWIVVVVVWIIKHYVFRIIDNILIKYTHNVKYTMQYLFVYIYRKS